MNGQPHAAEAPAGGGFEAIREFSSRLLGLMIRPEPVAEILPGVLRLLLERAGCEAVELHFREGNRRSRWLGRWRERRSFQFEIRPPVAWRCSREEADPVDRLCDAVLLGTLDLSTPGATRGGSFRTGDATQWPASLRGRSGRMRAASPEAGVGSLSVAVIPLKAGAEAVGLLLLRDGARNAFPEEPVSFFEAVAPTVAVVLAARDAQAALGERLKELTCLYGIARLVERSSRPPEDALQKIANLLPPALQYPEAAGARIVVDGKAFASPGFGETSAKIASNLVIRGRGRGTVEVAYRERKPDADEGPFLKEERSLLDTVTRQVAFLLEDREAQESRIVLQEQLRHADRLATLGLLAASVAHEINEPLSNVLGFAELAGKCPGLPEQAAADLRKITASALDSREIVRKLLGFVRQKPQVRTLIHLNGIVEEACALFEGRCAKAGIELARDLAFGIPEIVADPIGMNQMLVNLLVNAIQAMPRGGRLTVRTWAAGGRAFVAVEDTGVGMESSVIERIFDPFFTTKGPGEGTGLGLPVARDIVQSHGGSIHVESTPGKGTRFEIRLPPDGGKEAAAGS